MKQAIIDSCYIKSLAGLSYDEIGDQLNLSKATVCRAIAKITKSHDYQLALSTVATFLEEYQRAQDFFKYQMAQLEKRKESDPENYYKIMDMQMERMAMIVQLVGQGRIVMALKAMKDGKLQLQSNREPAQGN